jgi:hypothetical protein
MPEDLAGIPPHQQRVFEERSQLEQKIIKLTAFVDTATFMGLARADQSLLLEQLGHMRAYSGVLGARISRFN